MRRTALLVSTARKVPTGTYDNSGYGCPTHDLAFAEPAHDRSARRGIRLRWDGRDDGRKIDFELKGGGADAEAPELWRAALTGDSSGRKQIELPLTAFTSRTDCRPVGDIDHILGLTESRGHSVTLHAGTEGRGRRGDRRGGGRAPRPRRPSAADRPVRSGGGEAERGVPRGLSRRTARGGMPCGCRSRWVPATGTGAFVRSIR
ncbi:MULTISPECIES: carbohydrate binding domain-containing protein [unclassified Streptomyces]|uniref:carbohydrate binding domain-containing protein n=1 Tax=Streptomyces sp. KS_5 TaxID=1881018 RepID=UPI0004CAEFA7